MSNITRRNVQAREDKLFAMMRAQREETGNTAYSTERVVTDYVDHVQPRRVTAARLAAAQAQISLLGWEDETKSRAHRQLMKLVRR